MGKTILMCPPDYFDIDYVINPWMDVNQKASDSKFTQWKSLEQKFKELGHSVELLTPQKGLPDMVFIDCGVKYKDTFVLSNFKYKERKGESVHFKKWFEDYGCKVFDIPEEYYFEGHGDSLWAGKRLFLGYGFRTSVEAHFQIQDIIGGIDTDIEFIPIELVDGRFYHLDTCFCPLDADTALCFPEAFSKKAIKMLNDNIDLIEVGEEDALKFVCNSVVIGKDIIMPSGGKQVIAQLKELGYKVHEVEMSEFIKAGGACKCLSFIVN